MPLWAICKRIKGLITIQKIKGRPRLLDINIGDVHGDLQCVEIFYSEKDKQNVYKMKCLKCGREKIMKTSTIRRKSGITHKACGKGLKTQNYAFYTRWQGMRSRTNNPKYHHYKDYGGRGIKSDEFENFIDFYDAMYESFIEKANEIGEENVSLERVDVNGNYCKENCIWIDKHDQPKNQRRTVDFIAIFPNGHEEVCRNVQEFARKYNLDDQSIYDCISGKFKQHYGYRFKAIE